MKILAELGLIASLLSMARGQGPFLDYLNNYESDEDYEDYYDSYFEDSEFGPQRPHHHHHHERDPSESIKILS